MPKLETLADILGRIKALPWEHALFVTPTHPWGPESPCAVLDIDDCDPDEVPEFATKHGLKYALGVDVVQDVVINAREQAPKIGLEGIIDALNYYYEHDAFKEL